MMRIFPKFKSALVVRPKPKQFLYLTVLLFPYLGLQILQIIRALPQADIVGILSAVLLCAAAVWHVYRVRRFAEADVTEMLPSIIVLGALLITLKLLSFLCSLSAFSVAALAQMLVEVIYWIAVVICSVRAVCGRYKLIVPLILLFFGFFWPFIKLDLRSFDEILITVCHLLMVWFPVDAIVFTSLYVPQDRNPEKF